MSSREALYMAENMGLDLLEIAPNATPPVCKIMSFGKFQYHQAKREKESKKSQHQMKVKEIKVKPNIDDHDLQTKIKHARAFLEEGDKVRLTCVFRGRELLHVEIGEKLLQRICVELEDSSSIETPMKLLGKMISLVLAPAKKKKQPVGEKNG
jgi:translation initiation factor IF-3